MGCREGMGAYGYLRVELLRLLGSGAGGVDTPITLCGVDQDWGVAIGGSY